MCKSMSCGSWLRADFLYDTNVSEDHAASIFRMKMEAAWSYHSTARRHNPEDFDLYVHCFENIKSLDFNCFLVLEWNYGRRK
jgi:hypothetical protein